MKVFKIRLKQPIEIDSIIPGFKTSLEVLSFKRYPTIVDRLQIDLHADKGAQQVLLNAIYIMSVPTMNPNDVLKISSVDSILILSTINRALLGTLK